MELKIFPSVGEATAQIIVYFRALKGNTTAENLVTSYKIRQREQEIVRINRF